MKRLTTSPVYASSTRPLLWNTHHDQPETRRVAVIALLNQQLADVLDLGLQAKQAHWNVKGPQFASLHALFDEVAETAVELSDELAERAVAVGGIALGTLQSLGKNSRLDAYPPDALSGGDHIWALSAALARVAQSSRAAITAAEQLEDDGTTDVLTQVSRAIDKLLWKVEAHIALEQRG